jgi:hypothetical protein
LRAIDAMLRKQLELFAQRSQTRRRLIGCEELTWMRLEREHA